MKLYRMESLEMLNLNPDIATVWSCEGHYQDNVTTGWEDGYIMFAITEVGLRKLLRITDTIHKTHDDFYNSALSFTKRLVISEEIGKKPYFVNRWILTLRYNNVEMKDAIFKALERAISQEL